MNDFDFADDSGSIGCHEKSAQVVDDEFISTWALSAFPLEEGSEDHVPFGPKLVLTRFDSSETASMFRRTASSRPDICCNKKKH